MEWIDREKEFPDLHRILVFESGDVYICDLLETKWGNHYCSTDWHHGEYSGGNDWTHWMPLPSPPEE